MSNDCYRKALKINTYAWDKSCLVVKVWIQSYISHAFFFSIEFSYILKVVKIYEFHWFVTKKCEEILVRTQGWEKAELQKIGQQ